ncbi:hypothetical protein [Cobetia amphilecti]|uniref:hypothetical protein n=1 Tax=Cobetia amphilecti TaxID=1055104 RepID=UPI0032995EC9
MTRQEIPITHDIPIEEVYDKCPALRRYDAQKSKCKSIKRFKHENLLYLYRNYLVHEFRHPGKAIENDRHSCQPPFYQKTATINYLGDNDCDFSNGWELVYPVGFFVFMCKEALSVVVSYHENNKTSPFANYSDSSFWI